MRSKMMNGAMLGTVMVAGSAAPAAAPADAAPAHAAEADACTGPESEVRLFVTVTNVRSAKGLIAVTLYADDRRKFLAHHGSLYVGRVPAVAPTTRLCIHLPATGVYGLAVYHDEDGNRKFKRSTFGLPAEGYAFSNNASTFLGIPSFSSVRLPVPSSGTETSVKLKYP